MSPDNEKMNQREMIRENKEIREIAEKPLPAIAFRSAVKYLGERLSYRSRDGYENRNF